MMKALHGAGIRSLVGALGLGLVSGHADGQELRVRNNHELSYAGPVQFQTRLPDGIYRGPSSMAEVRGGQARVVTTLPAQSEVVLQRSAQLQDAGLADGPLVWTRRAHGFDLTWLKERIGSVELGLVVLPGATAGAAEAVAAFQPLDLTWTETGSGVLESKIEYAGYRLELKLLGYGGGWLDLRTHLTRISDTPGPAYVALVRRVSAPGTAEGRVRFNGLMMEGLNSPSNWERDFWYTRGVDWASWKAGPLSFVSTNGFTPLPPILKKNNWVEASHFYVWEQTRRQGEAVYLISQISGPNPDQVKSAYMPVTPYASMLKGDALDLKWRLAITAAPTAGWEESQLRVFAGYRSVARAGAVETVDLGVRGVVFGTSYFPYSTFAENFDFYRTPGINSETWWPFSARLWLQWRVFIPRMQTDLHIIRAMGFESVRLHHLELLQQMEQKEALAFMDWFTAAVQQLGMTIMVDTEGPAEWITLIAKRYAQVITRYELENEILIPGIKPADPARWKGLYQAAKRAAPDADVFLTSAGNHGMFERLRALDVPFDRVGLHAYKHGPEWKEAFSSHALGTGGYAADLNKPATLGEFNWKSLTRMSPEARRGEFAIIYGQMLEPRALPEFFQFHFQETMSVNPSIARVGIRHYETISLDRRPKPEALELMRLIRQYTRPDAPVRRLPIEVQEAQFAGPQAFTKFTVSNPTGKPVTVKLRTHSFEGAAATLTSPATVTVAPGGSTSGESR